MGIVRDPDVARRIARAVVSDIVLYNAKKAEGERAGDRRDRYLSRALPGLSRTRIQQLIGLGLVSLRGAEARPSARLKGNEGITGLIPPPRPLALLPPGRPLRGIVVVAKDDLSHTGLSAQLAAHRMDRRYHGIVWGRPSRAEGTVRTRVGRHPVHRKKMAVFPDLAWRSPRAETARRQREVPPGPGGGRRIAVTRYRCLDSFGGFSLLEFELAP